LDQYFDIEGNDSNTFCIIKIYQQPAFSAADP